jgi:hypothetical protein
MSRSCFWEPTQAGAWSLPSSSGKGRRATANAADFSEYDRMKLDFGL